VQQLVSYLDAHSGAASAILTLGILGLTILYVWSNFLLVKENRLLRKAGSDPEVVAYLLPDQRTPQSRSGKFRFTMKRLSIGAA
jgi:hypothetical protein